LRRKLPRTTPRNGIAGYFLPGRICRASFSLPVPAIAHTKIKARNYNAMTVATRVHDAAAILALMRLRLLFDACGIGLSTFQPYKQLAFVGRSLRNFRN
jgi:hypothetical protein